MTATSTNPAPGRLRRFGANHAGGLVTALLIMLAGYILGLARGFWELPNRIARVEMQSIANGVAIDSMRRTNVGVIAILCLGLSDDAFENAKQLCGDAFVLSRVITKERLSTKKP